MGFTGPVKGRCAMIGLTLNNVGSKTLYKLVFVKFAIYFFCVMKNPTFFFTNVWCYRAKRLAKVSVYVNQGYANYSCLPLNSLSIFSSSPT